eukprot:2341406-Pleurochrysis_carterae.AAC.2
MWHTSYTVGPHVYHVTRFPFRGTCHGNAQMDDQAGMSCILPLRQIESHEVATYEEVLLTGERVGDAQSSDALLAVLILRLVPLWVCAVRLAVGRQAAWHVQVGHGSGTDAMHDYNVTGGGARADDDGGVRARRLVLGSACLGKVNCPDR